MSAARQFVVSAVATVGWLVIAAHVVSCSAGASALRETKPCDPVTLAALTASCVAQVRACEPLPAACPAEDECLAALDARQTECLGRPAP